MTLTLAILADSGPFRGPQGVLTYRSSTLTSLTILTRFIDYYSPFWGKEKFPWFLNSKVRLRAGHQHSQFCLILARFMDYYSPFWGKEQFPWLLNPEVRLHAGH